MVSSIIDLDQTIYIHIHGKTQCFSKHLIYTYIFFFDYTPEAAFYLHLKQFEHFGNPQLACLVQNSWGGTFWYGILTWYEFHVPKTTAYLQ